MSQEIPPLPPIRDDAAHTFACLAKAYNTTPAAIYAQIQKIIDTGFRSKCPITRNAWRCIPCEGSHLTPEDLLDYFTVLSVLFNRKEQYAIRQKLKIPSARELTVLQLHDEKKLSYRQIAQQLGITADWVGQIYRAARLKQEVMPWP